MKSEKYKFLGMYGESPDITGGMGGEGVDAFAQFLERRRHARRHGRRRPVPDRLRLRALGGRISVDDGGLLRSTSDCERGDRAGRIIPCSTATTSGRSRSSTSVAR